MNWAPVDFLRPARPPRIGWALLAAGVMALALAIRLAERWEGERTTKALAAQAALSAQQAAKTTRPPSAQETQALLRLRQARLDMDRPWLSALRGIEAATASPVFLMSMTLDMPKGLARLEAEAPSFDATLAYVQSLDEQPSLHKSMLLSHEQAATAPGGQDMVKFSATTTWERP